MFFNHRLHPHPGVLAAGVPLAPPSSPDAARAEAFPPGVVALTIPDPRRAEADEPTDPDGESDSRSPGWESTSCSLASGMKDMAVPAAKTLRRLKNAFHRGGTVVYTGNLDTK